MNAGDAIRRFAPIVLASGLMMLMGAGGNCPCGGTCPPPVSPEQPPDDDCVHIIESTSGGIGFSCRGEIPGLTGCKRVYEDLDTDHGWDNNYLCGIAFEWSQAGPIDGMRCTQIYETHELEKDRTWDDNYLCVRRPAPGGVGSSFHFQWSQAGPIAGMTCLRWWEKDDPAPWKDNYLCW